jgi:hypothetical protein
MSTAVLMELMLEQVSPELRPAFATPMPIKGAIAVLAGGAGLGTSGVELAVPSSRMLPDVSTAPLMICAIAASTVPVLGAVLVPPSGNCTNWVKLATGVAGLQLLSTSPGWATGSPGFAWSERASTWLLLRM